MAKSPIITPVVDSRAPVALPRRRLSNEAAVSAPVWSLEASVAASNIGVNTVPLAAKCDVHNVERTVCCRELKGEDDRNLIDPDIIRDAVIGFSDGITVPLALTAGLSSLGSSRIVVLAGIAELVSGAISMGVGGFLSAQAERDHYRYIKRRTRERVARSCAGEMEREVSEVLAPLGIEESLSRRVAGSLLAIESTLPDPEPTVSMMRQFMSTLLIKIARKPKNSILFDEERASLLSEDGDGRAYDGHGHRHARSQLTETEDEKGLTSFLLKFGEGLEEVSDARLFISAFTIGASYFVAGLIPLMPYFFFESAFVGLMYSIGVTSFVLLLFGGFKTYYSGAEVGLNGYLWGCLSTLFVGGAAAGASFAIVKAMDGFA